MNKRLELCNADINKALFKNVLFFSVAEAGAMGEAGAVLFYVKSGELYYFNYVYGDVDMKKVETKFPILAECSFGIFGMNSSVPKGWHYVNLGMGNHLIVNDKVYDKFISEFPNDADPSILYQNWIEVAGKIIETNNLTKGK